MCIGQRSPLLDERFLLLETLGRGGAATVYRAFDRTEQRLVALKVHDTRRPAGPDHPIAAEFDAWSRLDHRNVVQALELARARSGPLAGGCPYLVLEHVDGRPVHRLPNRRLRDVRSVARQLFGALDHVHGHGLVHRDVSPHNVLASPGPRGDAGHVRLTDFGLAVPAGHAGLPGRISGSLPYVAPETLLGAPVDGRADLYAAGVLLYRLLVGRLPAARDPESIVRWHLDGRPADPVRERAALDGPLSRLVRRLTARDPAQRPADAAAALAALGEPVPGARRTPPPPQRADRARLRLALDAARLGALRVFRLPACRRRAEALGHEAAVWAQIRGVLHARLLPDGGARRALARLALRLLACHGRPVAVALRRHGLERWLPLELVGGVPVVAGPRPGRAAGSALDVAQAVAGFLIDSARGGTAVLVVPDGRADALLAAVVDRLERLSGPRDRPDPGRGGLLVLAGPR